MDHNESNPVTISPDPPLKGLIWGDLKGGVINLAPVFHHIDEFNTI